MEYKPLGSMVNRKIGYGIVQPGQSVPDGVPVIKVNNLISGLKSPSELDTTARENEAKYSRTRLHGGELIVSVVGTIGKTAIVPKSFAGCNLVRATALIDIEDRLMSKWVKYYFDSPCGQSYIEQNLNTTVQPTLNIKSLVEMPIPIRDTTEMEKNVLLLSALDEKIEVNRQINDNLAEQIRTLCNSWLSDYEPFGGTCPDDWEHTPLSSFAKFISGYSYKSSELQESTTAMATIKNFDRKGGFKLDGYKEIMPSSKLKSEHHVELFDTLVAHTDLTQNAEVIGNAEPVLSFSGYGDIIFSMDVVKVIPDNPAISKFLIAAMLQTRQFKGHCLGYVNGTTVLHLSKKALPEYSLMLPKDLSILVPLDEAVSSMYRQMALNIDENVQLANLRDSLLPQLMSGKLDASGLDL